MRHSMQKLHIRLMALTMTLALLLCAIPTVSAADTGICGKDLTWSFSGDTLVITGTGAMEDFMESTMAPWYDYRESINTVRLPAGLTRVGDLAFYGCNRITTVILPDSVTEIGWHAFDGCSSLTMLDLGKGLTRIEEGAFKACTGLTAVRLPDSLTTIGSRAFYRCESLAEITVPASVTSLGTYAFSLCEDLRRAEIRSSIEILPNWTFYGCSRLTTVSLPATLTGANDLAFYGCVNLENVIYTGSEENRAQIQEDISRDLSNGPDRAAFMEEEPDYSSSVSVEQTNDGYVVSNGSSTQTENAAISTDLSTSYSNDNTELGQEGSVSITLENGEGWADVLEMLSGVVDEADHTQTHIYLKGDFDLPADALASLAGKNVTVTVHTASGSVWKVDCSQLKTGKTDWNLACERTDATAEQLSLMSCPVGYQIKFLADTAVNTEVMIRLPVEHAGKTATLFLERGGLELIQTVVVDHEGYAHFYLASVSKNENYLIGINATLADANAAVIPDSLYDQYGITGMSSNLNYEITGRTSSWGLNFNQVTWIMVAVLFVVVLTVGLTMYALNRRKLQQGYVPDLEEDGE